MTNAWIILAHLAGKAKFSTALVMEEVPSDWNATWPSKINKKSNNFASLWQMKSMYVFIGVGIEEGDEDTVANLLQDFSLSRKVTSVFLQLSLKFLPFKTWSLLSVMAVVVDVLVTNNPFNRVVLYFETVGLH